MSLLKQVLLAAAFTGCLAGSLPAAHAQGQSEARTALVIGNGGYSYSKLGNPVNDARDMADALRGAGFEVILKTDADQAGMKDAIRTFGDALKTKGGVGLLFYAGHGVQLNGENYILPIGERPGSEGALKAGAIAAAEVVDAMAAARNGLNIVILDACRDNPLQAGSGATSGLSRIDSSSSLFVSFSTSPGEVALDGTGRNSPYTKYLKGAIGTSNLTIEDTFKRTLKGVYQETGGKQQPWISSSFFGEFVFRPNARPPAAAIAAPPPPPQQQAGLANFPRMVPGALTSGTTLALGGLYLVEGTNPNGSRYRGMVALTPAGNQFRFTWWISRQIFSGVGQFAGRMLVVNWGAKSPVIYTVNRNDNLDGEWADGSATERLVLYALAVSGAVTPPEGTYNVAGRNPNGSRYAGRVTIARQGNRYQLDWRVGSTSYHGTGTLDGNVLVVDWGSSTPVIYSLTADGTLKGLWDAGRAEETLTPSR
jgi:Caspase domain